MQAMVFYESEALERVEISDRFEFEDQWLSAFVKPRPCRRYTEHHPNPQGVRVFRHPETLEFHANPYLEFAKHLHGESHFHVMQEGQPTGFIVVIG